MCSFFNQALKAAENYFLPQKVPCARLVCVCRLVQDTLAILLLHCMKNQLEVYNYEPGLIHAGKCRYSCTGIHTPQYCALLFYVQYTKTIQRTQLN